MEKSPKVLRIVVALLVVSNLFFAGMFLVSVSGTKKLNDQIQAQKVNEKIIAFTQLFMDKVLGGNKEVSFDDRLQLENTVRDLNDKEIFESWQNFTKAKNPAEVQSDFYALFQLLLKKITV